MKKKIIYIAFMLLCQITFAQCYPDRHSTSWFDGWVSCETSTNPITSYGETHWIMYDFGYEYVLNESKFWNANEPKNLQYGINDFNIDYSIDGVTWTNLGEFQIEQASGLSTYEGDENGPDFNGAKARYVLITPTTNFGGNCFGFSEIKINITDPFEVINEEEGFNALVYPNPFENDITLRIVTLDENLPVTYRLFDILGREILNNTLDLTEDIETYPIPLNGQSLSIGIYILNIEQNSNIKSFKLIKRE
ncbi:T9SS type A sorting domain-containing protein [Flaviramulus sp. BrNp1-15]|uniref:T9SS type A sorting domain-containing protein n=1 Tax=Flaviramulus sp. BrNp1-15 TaxID=2916754 RepID=UPI001EE94212|nr:T9SS type A sorting domain-containing protein [Flaviramulus sp. BrNp1-15]ULC60816.1 T9SS type A sorting domain-containing protein [Flaviramulus sp. BrNp1-15]